MSKIISIEQYQEEIQLEASIDALQSTCLFFKIIDDLPYSHGTGVLVKIDYNYFLLTAAHVIEGYQNELFIRLEKNEAYRPGGIWKMNSLLSGQQRKNDKLDIACLKLDDESIVRIGKIYKFLGRSEIELEHVLKPLPYYTAIGFPSSRNKLDFNKIPSKVFPLY